MNRMLIGVVMGNVLPESLVGLSARMSVNEQELEKKLEMLAERLRNGLDATDHTARECARVLKVAKYFRDKQRCWQLGVIFITASTVERLQWLVIGTLAGTR